MAEPAEELVTLLEAAGLPSDVSLFAYPTDEITAPAIVIRPATDWMGQSSFCFAVERYVAIAVVKASTPGDGIALLRLLSRSIITALTAPWDWESVEGPIVDDTTGTPFLANRIRLTYNVEAP